MKTYLIAGLCVLFAGCTATELARRACDLAAERSLSAALSRAPGVHVGRIRSRTGSSAIEVDDFSMAGPGWRFAADRITLPGVIPSLPSLISPVAARPAAAGADNVSLTLSNTKIVVPHIEARGTDLTSHDLAALLDPTDPATLSERLSKLTAGQISAPTVVLGSPRLPDPSTGDHLTFKAVSLTDVVAGRIGALSIASAAFSSPPSNVGQQGAPQTVLFETGRVRVDGIDLPLALEMATGSRTEATTALQAITRSISVSGVLMRPDTSTTVQIGAVLAGALRGRALTLPPGDVLSLVAKPAAARTPADRQILSEVIADAVGSAALDHLEVRDAVMTKARGDQGSFKIGRAVLDGWDVFKLGSLAVDDAAFSVGSVDVSLGRFVLGGYDGSGLVDVFKRQIMEVSDATATQIVPSRTSLTLVDLHVAVPVSSGGTGPTDTTKRAVVDIPVASVEGGLDPATGAITSRASIELSYDVSAGAADPTYRDLIQYGVSRLDIGADYAGNFNPTTKQINLERLTLDAQNLGQLAMGAVLGNASPDMFQSGQGRGEILEAAQNLVFQSFTLVFVNTGIVEKILPPLAASAKVSVPLMKAQMKAEAELSIGEMLGTSPATTRIVAAVRTFIDTPKNLTIVVKAPSGLSVATAASTADPKTLLRGLDIQVVTNR